MKHCTVCFAGKRLYILKVIPAQKAGIIYFWHMNSFISAITVGFSCAIIGVVMIVVMANEPILNWWFRFGYRVGVKKVSGREVERWFYKPIWGCEKCLSGQLALWSYLFFHFRIETAQFARFGLAVVYYPYFCNYSPFWHALCISTGILSAVFISHLTKKITECSE